MKIRSITAGIHLDPEERSGCLERAARFLQHARDVCQDAGIEVQTLRVATQPVSDIIRSNSAQEMLSLAQSIDSRCGEAGIDYASLGPIRGERQGSDPSLASAIPAVIADTARVFCSVSVASRDHGISLPAIEAAAEAIRGTSVVSEDGFGNTRLAVLANCGPHSPFFPAAYHAGEEPAASVALESADLAVAAFAEATSLEGARNGLLQRVEGSVNRIESLLAEPAREHGFIYTGVDLSLAPYPADDRSIANAIEALGARPYGANATLFICALMSDVLRRAHVTKCGFSGVMHPLLEDSIMARRSIEGTYTLDSLLLYSAVCGTGLDTIPLPGDVTAEQLAGILLDVATLATVLDKPLTARLLPIPGKSAGDLACFDFEYFADARILGVPGGGIGDLLRKGDHIKFATLHQFDGAPAP